MHFRQNFNFVIFFRLRFRTSFRVSTSSHFRSLFNQILFFTFRTHNAAAYAERVSHVAPSPLRGEGRAPGGRCSAPPTLDTKMLFLKAFLQGFAYTSLPIHVISFIRLNIDAESPLSKKKMHFRQNFNFVIFFGSR